MIPTAYGFNPDSEIGKGGTGDPPVPSGHRPDETATRAATPESYNCRRLPFPTAAIPMLHS